MISISFKFRSGSNLQLTLSIVTKGLTLLVKFSLWGDGLKGMWRVVRKG